MRHPRIIIAGIGLAAVAAVGGITAASAGSRLPAARPSPAKRRGGDRAHRLGDRRRQDRDHPGQRRRPAAVLLPARHCGEVVRHRGAGPAVAAADLGRAYRSRD